MRGLERIYNFLGLTGFILTLFGLYSVFFLFYDKWYTSFVIGGTLFLGYINHKLRHGSFFEKLIQQPKTLLLTYGLYVISALLIDAVGKQLFRLWHYPSLNPSEQIFHVYLLGYPFAFFMVYESWILIKHSVTYMPLAFIITFLVNAFVHEIPNTYAGEWIYTIPFITSEIFGVNIVVILGWSLLLKIPFTINKQLFFK
ncbi:hypothetical protein A3B02_00495 [Candidatus Roizmanbacteria bacterium RIFCSPLOWO2_01_FULL_42_14]|uniref:Uncharacterized protein n=3 Tax=Candidatus Roizmaniibacteriota TaxID=1752723 RepID=A0A1F7K018_9BACT|nr:MAG: hypothetical protein A3F32_00865 [Candidatus Roizmanbacteria bacterium RIFCSPHIGHO2_12_FULL_42_10]OGK52733.1 MAG: hypothetical protein A3B02_00495 [Candidatus Roizmanbacteria bacterium RIFCSPLOWO2_01_FULL_42_14]OGK61200.1 MAG: hypothetical protein A3I56_03855 [Candidatus Roizmanbacteria bacterium RIFCSPLOWO2_02_FULL_43_10]